MDVSTLSSRTQHLYYELVRLGFSRAVQALELVISEMCAEKGYKRLNGVHYYYHLVDVTQILINMRIKENKDEDLLVAALLHDIVEDVPDYTIDRIEKMFGGRVGRIVFLLTKQPGVDYSNYDNLRDYLSNILEDEDATYIKTSDRIHNFSTLNHTSFEKKMKQVYETEHFFIPFFKKARNRYTQYSYFFFYAKTSIEPILWEIQSHYETYQKYIEAQNRSKGYLSKAISFLTHKMGALFEKIFHSKK